jgi:hypothetical protein
MTANDIEYCCDEFKEEATLDPYTEQDGIYKRQDKWFVIFEGEKVISLKYCPFCGTKVMAE